MDRPNGIRNCDGTIIPLVGSLVVLSAIVAIAKWNLTSDSGFASNRPIIWVVYGGFCLGLAGCIWSLWRLLLRFPALAISRIPSFFRLHDCEERYRGLFEASSDAMAVFDKRGVIDCNSATLQLFGYPTKAALYGVHPGDLSPKTQPGGIDSRALAESRIMTALETGTNRFEWIHCRSDGTEFPAEVVLDPFWLEGKQVFLAVVRDISDRKQLEEQYRLLASRISDVIWAADLEWNWDYVSPSTERFTGFTVEESLRNTLDDVLTPDSARVAKEAAKRAVAEALERPSIALKTIVLELEFIRKDGSTVWAEVNATLVPGENGRPVRWVGVTRDITARRQIEAQLASAKEVAEEADRAKSEFLANMSHEIRTPLTAILGFAGLLQDECTAGRISAVGADAVATIASNGEHLLNVINDILDLSKIEAGKLTVERIQCCPERLIAEVVELMAVRAKSKGLLLEADYLGPIPEVISSDALRLRQVLVNLVGNAIKFTESGEVRITTHLVGVADNAPKLEISVSDTGRGISADDTTRLFSPFMQADSSTSRQFGGTGLGLAISLRLARLLGGDIKVCSQIGRGSTFRLTVDTGPLDDVRLRKYSCATEQATRPQSPTETTRTLSLTGRILLVEDGQDNQRLISRLIERAGAEVAIAENGRQACEEILVAVADGTPYDLVLMDMQMPVMDGYEATRVLREAGYAAPIIALTAHAMVGDEQKCLDAGCDAYLTKPINRDAFLPCLASFLDSVTTAD